MQRATMTPRLSLAFILLLSLTAVGCDSDGGNGGEEEVLFRMTPDDGGSVFEIRPRASWHEPTDPPCQLQIYDIEGSDRYFQFATLDDDTCPGVFEAQIEQGGVVYFVTGTVLRTFGTGSGPFATGTWSTSDGSRSGTFQFFEGGFLD
jgi:hypothetical protein